MVEKVFNLCFSLVLWDHLGHLANEDFQECQVCQDRKVTEDSLDWMVPKVAWDHLERRGKKVLLDLQVLQGNTLIYSKIMDTYIQIL